MSVLSKYYWFVNYVVKGNFCFYYEMIQGTLKLRSVRWVMSGSRSLFVYYLLYREGTKFFFFVENTFLYLNVLPIFLVFLKEEMFDKPNYPSV